MDFPHGRHHEPHHRRDEEQQDYPPPPVYGDEPPPPYYGMNEPPPPRYNQSSEVYHTSHVGGPDSYRPPPPHASHDYDPPPYAAGDNRHQHQPHIGPPPPHASHDYDPPPYAAADNRHQHQPHIGPPPPHASHDYDPPPYASADNRHQHHPHLPHFPSSDHHQTPHHGGGGIDRKPSVKVYSKAETNFALTIRDGKVVLTRSDPSDPLQHWIKEEKYSTKVKDEQGFPSFALINKATGQAIKHAIGATHPVQLTPYNSNTVDESILWTESKDLGDGYRTIRMVNNIKLNVDAFNGDANHGGVHEGTTIVLWEWKKGDNQRWKITSH